MSAQMQPFEAEVGRVLDLVDQLALPAARDLPARADLATRPTPATGCATPALTEPELLGDDPELKIRPGPDEAAGTLTVADNGIGMNRDELVENLGTIARSGTAALPRAADAATATKDLNLIGQFGVGFYSAFMVADQVEVV